MKSTTNLGGNEVSIVQVGWVNTKLNGERIVIDVVVASGIHTANSRVGGRSTSQEEKWRERKRECVCVNMHRSERAYLVEDGRARPDGR